MQTLTLGNVVFLLRFFPDGRRLVVGTHDAEGRVAFDLLSLPGGERVRMEVPGAILDPWVYRARYGNAVAIHPDGETCFIAWGGRLRAFRTSDVGPRPVPDEIRAHQIALSPDGGRLLAAELTGRGGHLLAAEIGPDGGAVTWRRPVPESFTQLVGFLPGGERFATLEAGVGIRSAADGEVLATGRIKPMGTHQPQLSPDGRCLGAIGYGNLYFFDVVDLGKPRKIGGSSNFGDFRSFAFRPDGRTVAVIHGGPTLIKVYDLATLKRIDTIRWKLGPLRSVAFGPDGALGAAGSEDGRLVVWDDGA